MKKDFDRIDEVFREALNDYQEVPSEHVWKSMSKKLLLLDFARFNLVNFPKYLLLYSLTAIVSVGSLSYFLISQHGLEHLSDQETVIVAEHSSEGKNAVATLQENVSLNNSEDHQKTRNKTNARSESQKISSSNYNKTIVSDHRQRTLSSDKIKFLSSQNNSSSKQDKNQANKIEIASAQKPGSSQNNPPNNFNLEKNNGISAKSSEGNVLLTSNENASKAVFMEVNTLSDTDHDQTTDENLIASTVEPNLISTLGVDSAFTGDSIDLVLTVPADFDPSVERIPPTRKAALSLEFFGAPTLVSTNLSTDNDLIKSYINKRSEEEKSLISFLLGAEVKYEINRINFVSGINYSEFKEKTEYDIELQTGVQTVIVRDTVIDPNTGKTSIRETSVNVPVYEPAVWEKNNKLKYIEIPVLVGYKFRESRKLTFDVFTGVSYSYLTTSKGYIMEPYELAPGTKKRMPFNTLDLSNQEESPYRKSNINLLLRVGGSYKVNDKWSVVLRPSMKYNITSALKKELPYSQRFYIFGLNTGINYKF